MTKLPTTARLAAVVGLATSLAGCESLVREEGPSIFAGRAPPPVVESGQRIGPDGYPLLGAFPRSAAGQLTDPVVTAERSGLQSSAGSQKAVAASESGNYQRSVTALQAVKAEQARLTAEATAPAGSDGAADAQAARAEQARILGEGEAAGTAAPPAEAAPLTQEEILREIEAGR